MFNPQKMKKYSVECVKDDEQNIVSSEKMKITFAFFAVYQRLENNNAEQYVPKRLYLAN